MRSLLSFLCFTGLCLLLSGCASTQSVKNVGRGIKDAYAEHVNTPARLALDYGTYAEPYEIELATAITEVDYQLEHLLRAMDDSDRGPDEEWAAGLLRTYPWLSDIMIADGQGRILESMSRKPGTLLPAFPLLVEESGGKRTALRACVLNGLQGPEVYVAKPIYVQNELRALITACFDMRNLLSRAGRPEKFLLFAPASPLWPAGYNLAETPLRNVDWATLGVSDVDGRLRDGKREFYWLSAYFANMRLFYVLPVAGDFSINTGELEALQRRKDAPATGNRY